MSRGPARFEVWNAANDTSLADLNQVGESGKVDDVLSDVGLLSVTVGLDEAAAEFCVEGNHVRAYLGERLMFTGLIEDNVQSVSVAVQSADRVVNLSCRGHAAVFSQVPIAPHGGLSSKPQSTDRPHKWSSPETDISVWDDVDVRYTSLSEPWSDDPDHDPPYFEPWLPPVGFFDETAAWLWSRSYDGVHADPVGESLFAADFTVANAGLHEFQVAADDGFDLEIDGIAIGSGSTDPADSFIKGSSFTFELSVGTHRIGVVGKNYARPVTAAVGTFGGPNVGRIALAIYDRTTLGANQLVTDDDLIFHSDSSWKCLDYPTTWPAPTDGAIIRIHLEEAQAEGALLDVTLDFSDTVDSNGNAWVDNGAFSLQVDEDDMLTMLQSMANSGRIDWRFDPAGKTLRAYNYGTMGSAVSASFGVGSGLLGLTGTTLPRVGSFRVRHKTGRFLLGSGFPRKALTFADLSEADARAQAQRQYDAMSTATSSKVVGLELGPWENSASFPYATAGWGVGDSPSFGGDVLRVVKLSTAIDAAGWPTFVPEVETRFQGARERQEVQLNKATGGTLNGRSRAATPADGLTKAIVGGQCQRADKIAFVHKVWVTETFDQYYDTTNALTWEESVLLQRVKYRQEVRPVSVDSTVEIHRVGPGGDDVIATVVLPVGKFKAEVVQGMAALPAYTYISELEGVYAVWTTHDASTGDPSTDTIMASCELVATLAHPAAVDPPKVDVPWE